jgi:uncharacterized membrane protein
MVFRIAGGIAFLLIAATDFGFNQIPLWATGLACLIAGIALVAGSYYTADGRHW